MVSTYAPTHTDSHGPRYRSNGHFRELFKRYPNNPILTAADWPYAANTVFNAGATRLANGETLLLVRVEDRRGISHLTVARSADGLSGWRIDSTPTMLPQPGEYPEELWGIEDPRIVWLPELGQYSITYTAYSRNGPLVALALTRDFKTFERCGPIMPPEDKDAALFPRKFGGRWGLIHRPVPNHAGAKANMWLSFSPDLKHWGDYCVLLEARSGSYWDAGKIGLSPPPIETPEGWLIIYHGVKHTPAGALYRGGMALLDLEDPRIVLRRGDEWVFGPEEPYELTGDVPNVVFPCGVVVDEPSGTLRMYYGAADTCMAVATAKVADLLDWLRADPNPLVNWTPMDDLALIAPSTGWAGADPRAVSGGGSASRPYVASSARPGTRRGRLPTPTTAAHQSAASAGADQCLTRGTAPR